MCALRLGEHAEWRQLIPGPALEQAASFFLLHAAPLFEKEGYAGAKALIANVCDPGWINWTRTGPRLTSHDGEVDALQVHLTERPQQRFERKELHLSGSFAEMVNAVQIAFAFDTHAHPDIGRPLEVSA